MSEMGKAARALVEIRTEPFESRHDLATSRKRLGHALRRSKLEPDASFQLSWREAGGKTLLVAHFKPSRATIPLLNGLSMAMVSLLSLSGWILATPGEGAHRFLVPMFAVLSILALPFLTLGLSSARAAREARIHRAIRAALLDADEAFPPQQKWDDEE
jgi:hypothetical protein